MIRSEQHHEAIHFARLFGGNPARGNELHLSPNAASGLHVSSIERVELCEPNVRCADRNDSLASSEERLQLQRLLDPIVGIAR